LKPMLLPRALPVFPTTELNQPFWHGRNPRPKSKIAFSPKYCSLRQHRDARWNITYDAH
jgi:hypothetical protein